MIKRKLFIKSAGKLEALIEAHPGSPAEAVIVCHPHPQYGGDMNHGVVMAAYDWAKEAKCLGVRFNFRGVGQSEGTFDNGDGEQADLAAVVDYVRREYRVKRVTVVGYSFGAWVAFRFARVGGRAESLILISPPVSIISPWDPPPAPMNVGIVYGSEDAFCLRDIVDGLAASLGARVHVVGGADHFWSGREGDIPAALDELLPRFRAAQ
ncbi:MAG: alpha/beta fold hydrolase [Nitrospirae bacterium]|nr:alpha/beta fold hydrolase [Nitrospirota bacterium]